MRVSELANELGKTSKEVLDIITAEESKKELLESIELLDERYKNAIYIIIATLKER